MSKVKLLKYLLQILVILTLALFMSNNPGQMVFHWLGYETTVDMTIFFLGIISFLTLLFILMNTWHWVWNLPIRLAQNRRLKRTQKADYLCFESLTAFAAGEFDESLELSTQSQYLNEKGLLALVLSAQAAYAKGDNALAIESFTALLHHEKTAFLGLRGLILLAQQNGHYQQAVSLLQKAYALRPNSPWIIKNLLDWDIKSKFLHKAEHLVDQLTFTQNMSTIESNRLKGLIHWLKAEQALADKRFDDYHDNVQKALQYRPALSETVFSLAAYYSESNRFPKALKVLCAGYQENPLLKYAAVLKSLSSQSSLELYKEIVTITQSHNDHPITMILRADFAVTAQLWGEAREHLAALKKMNAYPIAYAALALAVEQEDAHWQKRAPYCSLTDTWTCYNCHHHQANWIAICPKCDKIDSLTLEESKLYSPHVDQEYERLSFSM